VGPDLTGIGGREKREHLLESLVDPNRKIARGFETVVLLLASGEARSGVLKTETDSEVTITGVDGQTLAIGKQEIAERTAGPSAMPEDLMKTLSERDLRDLVEYLASLR
jgi:quinoprotein glucose dehydrogenase